MASIELLLHLDEFYFLVLELNLGFEPFPAVLVHVDNLEDQTTVLVEARTTGTHFLSEHFKGFAKTD